MEGLGIVNSEQLRLPLILSSTELDERPEDKVGIAKALLVPPVLQAGIVTSPVHSAAAVESVAEVKRPAASLLAAPAAPRSRLVVQQELMLELGFPQ